MSAEAIWSLRISTKEVDLAVGCVGLESGRVMGGDTAFTYSGNYWVNSDNVIMIRVRVKKYSKLRETVYKDDYILNLKGIYDDREFSMAGYPDDKKNIALYVHCVRQDELPDIEDNVPA